MKTLAATTTAETLHRKAPTVDQQIEVELKTRIEASPYVAIRQLVCDFREGIAILRGKVPTYHTRQIAIGLAQAIEGVEMLDDRIQVSHGGD